MSAKRTPAFTRRQLLLAGSCVAAIGSFPRIGLAAGKKVLLVGDSMIATGLGQRIEFGLEESGFSVHRRGKSSSGLARPDFFDWMSEAAKLVKKHQPAASVVMMGGNDAQALKMRKGWLKWGEPGWVAEYTRRVEAMIGLVSPEEQPVAWIGLPIARSPSYRRKLEKVNAIMEEVAESHQATTFVSTWNVLTKGGVYTPTMKVGGKEQAVRGSDGIHLTVAGARVLERKLRPKIIEALGAAST